MALPPAAETARYVAELSMKAPEANFRPCETVLNHSPGNPDQLICSYRAGAECLILPFVNAKASASPAPSAIRSDRRSPII